MPLFFLAPISPLTVHDALRYVKIHKEGNL